MIATSSLELENRDFNPKLGIEYSAYNGKLKAEANTNGIAHSFSLKTEFKF